MEAQKLVPAKTLPTQEDQVAITDAVSFLAYAQDAKLPTWFDKNLSDGSVFKSKLGFDQRWPETQNQEGTEYLGTYLSRPTGAMIRCSFNFYFVTYAFTRVIYKPSGFLQTRPVFLVGIQNVTTR